MATTSRGASCGVMAATIASASARSSACSACRVQGADDFFRMQPLLLGNSLLLKNGGEDDAIGEREAFDKFACQHFTAECV